MKFFFYMFFFVFVVVESCFLYYVTLTILELSMQTTLAWNPKIHLPLLSAGIKGVHHAIPHVYVLFQLHSKLKILYIYIKDYTYIYIFFWVMVSLSSGWPQTFYIAKNGFELLILLPLPPESATMHVILHSTRDRKQGFRPAR